MIVQINRYQRRKFFFRDLLFFFGRSNFIALQLILFLSCISFQLYAVSQLLRPLKINIFSENNGKGLQQSRRILKEALEDLGHRVSEKERVGYTNEKEAIVDINIFFETLIPEGFPLAHLNWFVPNPEWYSQPVELLQSVDLVLCRNRLVEKIFKPISNATYYLGFSSQNYYDESIRKDFSFCLHLAGGSNFKGTDTIVKAWTTHRMPMLFLQLTNYKRQHPLENEINWILHRLPSDQLKVLHNYCGIHLCLSEVEGWGHYLIEGMSAGGVVITTDAPPMNEYITDKRCLVPYETTVPCHLGTRFRVHPDRFTETLKNVLKLPEEELKSIGERNRLKYSQMTEEFKANLQALIEITAMKEGA